MQCMQSPPKDAVNSKPDARTSSSERCPRPWLPQVLDALFMKKKEKTKKNVLGLVNQMKSGPAFSSQKPDRLSLPKSSICLTSGVCSSHTMINFEKARSPITCNAQDHMASHVGKYPFCMPSVLFLECKGQELQGDSGFLFVTMGVCFSSL